MNIKLEPFHLPTFRHIHQIEDAGCLKNATAFCATNNWLKMVAARLDTILLRKWNMLPENVHSIFLLMAVFIFFFTIEK